MRTIILGDGHLGWAIASAAAERGQRTPVLGAGEDPARLGRRWLDRQLVPDLVAGPA